MRTKRRAPRTAKIPVLPSPDRFIPALKALRIIHKVIYLVVLKIINLVSGLVLYTSPYPPYVGGGGLPMNPTDPLNYLHTAQDYYRFIYASVVNITLIIIQ